MRCGPVIRIILDARFLRIVEACVPFTAMEFTVKGAGPIHGRIAIAARLDFEAGVRSGSSSKPDHVSRIVDRSPRRLSVSEGLSPKCSR